jgi:putative addiction module CopG family antidote
MDILLSPEHQSFVERLVENGVFGSPSEALNEAVYLLRQQNEQNGSLERLRQEIAAGLEEVRSGVLIPGHDAIGKLRVKLQDQSRP